MPGIIRKLAIYAAAEGLILHVHGSSEYSRYVKIEYKTNKITSDVARESRQHDGATRLESHGLLGCFSIASYSYLIAITKREQVAQIFGKPIYVVSDVALLPLTSQDAANDAIKAALEAHGSSENPSDSDLSDSEDEDTQQDAPTMVASTPAGDVGPLQSRNASSTSIAENVATRNLPFGRFASQWLSRQSWGSRRSQSEDEDSDPIEQRPAVKANETTPRENAAEAPLGGQSIDAQWTAASPPNLDTSFTSTNTLIPRILRTTRLLFTSNSYFFSYDFDLTRRLEKRGQDIFSLDVSRLDPVYFWNRKLGSMFLNTENEPFLVPVIQGFVGQRSFSLKKKSDKMTMATGSTTEDVTDVGNLDDTYLLTIVSRRSTRRSGLRYLRRGIDDDGYCANFAETEQILSAADWNSKRKIRSFTQLRGSIPLYFSQSPYQLKPTVVFSNSPEANFKAFSKHFQLLKRDYGKINIAMLIDKHGTEKPAGEAYEKLYNQLKDTSQAGGIDFEWFDFHAECRGMKFENVQRLVEKEREFLDSCAETVLSNDTIATKQKGTIRTNCMDCLDRTNVTQSAFAQYKLQKHLEEDGYEIDLVKDASTSWFNVLWADNGDAISRQYASTAALKGDYTRTRKRNWRGAMNDFGLTVSRYYSNMFNDYFAQTVIDVLLQNVSWKVFEDFESTMMSTDPGISVQSVRESAIDRCAKMVIPDNSEDLIHGWTMMIPAQENTLRTLPFEEAVVILTDTAVYCCKMDWSTEKIARFEKVDLRSIQKIKYGPYITSTFTAKQLDPTQNQGILITYSPGKGDVIRVNTRSLQNAASAEHGTSVDGGTGIMSWLAPKQGPTPPRTLAMKVIPLDAESEDDMHSSKTGSPQQIAESVGDEIRRAILGSDKGHEEAGKDLVESGDIISADDAKRRTGYMEQVSQSIRRLVWAA